MGGPRLAFPHGEHMTDLTHQGMKTRRRVLGDAHVDRA